MSGNRDLGFQWPQLRVVPRHEELVQKDYKEEYGRSHLAGLHHDVQKMPLCQCDGLVYILSRLSGKAKSVEGCEALTSNSILGRNWAFPFPLIPLSTAHQAAEPRQTARTTN